MTNTKFNRLWDMLHKIGHIEFSDHGESLTLSLVPSRYGYDVSLRGSLNTILVHYNKDRFREILVD